MTNGAPMTADGPAPRHALLLSGSLGMGHDVMAAACAASFDQRGWRTTTMNSLRLMGAASAGLGERAFRALLAVPGAYDALHFGQLRPGGAVARFAERTSSRRVVPALHEQLEASQTDVVVSVFATGAAAASRVKHQHAGLRTVVVCSDVCPHRLWVHDNTDLYLVTSTSALAFVRMFHPGAAGVVVPTPVRPQFYAAPAQSEARAELGVPEGAPCVLLMTGAWGLGPLVEVATALASAGIYTVAVAGRNAAATAALRSASNKHDRLIPIGFTDQIPLLMAACDVVVTSSGDTCSEARVVGRHLLLLDVVPGHGRENLQRELERGDADVAPTDPAGLRRSVFACLEGVSPPKHRVAQTRDAWEAAFDDALARIGFDSGHAVSS